MKVTTSCLTRFHIFDQALQLNKHGLLHKLITGYPKFLTKKWNFPDNQVVSLFSHGLKSYLINKINDGSADKWHLTRLLHDSFSKKVSKVLPLDSNFFIGQSSFCLEALTSAKKEGIIAVVDHGSLHEEFEKEVLERECEIFGFRKTGNWTKEWLIEKENQEFKQADYIFVGSDLAKKTFIDRGVNAEKIFVNNYGVDLSHFSPGIKQDKKFRIIQCSSIIPRKGIHYLLKAFHELNLPNSELWFIGGGLKEALKDEGFSKIINKYSASNVFFKGAYPQGKLSALYNQGSIFVLPSLADGFAMTVLQAMACGLPCIITKNTGASDIIADGENGFIVPAADVETLKEKISFLYENYPVLEKISAKALETVKSGFTWDDYGNRLSAFWDDKNV